MKENPYKAPDTPPVKERKGALRAWDDFSPWITVAMLAGFLVSLVIWALVDWLFAVTR